MKHRRDFLREAILAVAGASLVPAVEALAYTEGLLGDLHNFRNREDREQSAREFQSLCLVGFRAALDECATKSEGYDMKAVITLIFTLLGGAGGLAVTGRSKSSAVNIAGCAVGSTFGFAIGDITYDLVSEAQAPESAPTRLLDNITDEVFLNPHNSRLLKWNKISVPTPYFASRISSACYKYMRGQCQSLNMNNK